MSPATVPAQLLAILDATPDVRLAILFGSRARGTGRPDSDLDLALRLGGEGLRGEPRLIAELERAAGQALDVVLMDDAPPLLRFEIARDGVIVLERAAGEWADFRARAMIDWWDWAPYAARFAASSVERLRSEVRRGAT